MKLVRIITAAALMAGSGLALQGCAASYGQKIEADNVSKIVKGKTTRTELIQMFGQPTQAIIMPDGGRTLYFVYFRNSLGSTFGQMAQIAAGKGQAKTGTNLSVVLDKNDVVKDYEFAAGN